MVAAREPLNAALALFRRLGAAPWVAQTRAQLRASGRRSGSDGQAALLTAQEHTVAVLAASGLTNKEIAERLVISPRTVSVHLYRVFPKLGVASRVELAAALARRPAR
jgi:DNA-binding CsgD family transcriptional regulator